MHKIRIVPGDSPVVRKWQVYLDDKDISNLIQGMLIDLRAGELPIITLDCVCALEFDGEIKGCFDVYNSKEHTVDSY